MNKILSIIIPSYNTERYIDECLPTMLADEILNEIEILLINDGSTDNTPILAEKYVEKYPQTVKLINKENGGHGSVINRGIVEATGKYFKVIDGDDWVDTEGLKKLVSKLKKLDVDMVLNPYCYFMLESGSKKLIDTNLNKNEVYDFEQISDILPFVAIHNVTYRTKILKDNQIKFQENCYYEDLEYDLYPLQYVNSIISLDIPVVVYRIGAPTQSINVQNVLKNKKMIDIINNNLLDFYKNLPHDISYNRKEYFARCISGKLNTNCSLFLKMKYGKEGKDGLKEYFQSFKNNCSELYEYKVPGVIRLIRKDSWLWYSIAYISFKLARYRRGF